MSADHFPRTIPTLALSVKKASPNLPKLWKLIVCGLVKRFRIKPQKIAPQIKRRHKRECPHPKCASISLPVVRKVSPTQSLEFCMDYLKLVRYYPDWEYFNGDKLASFSKLEEVLCKELVPSNFFLVVNDPDYREEPLTRYRQEFKEPFQKPLYDAIDPYVWFPEPRNADEVGKTSPKTSLVAIRSRRTHIDWESVDPMIDPISRVATAPWSVDATPWRPNTPINPGRWPTPPPVPVVTQFRSPSYYQYPESVKGELLLVLLGADLGKITLAPQTVYFASLVGFFGLREGISSVGQLVSLYFQAFYCVNIYYFCTLCPVALPPIHIWSYQCCFMHSYYVFLYMMVGSTERVSGLLSMVWFFLFCGTFASISVLCLWFSTHWEKAN